MKKRRIVLLALMFLLFFLALRWVENSYDAQGRQQLEQAVRRTALSCYASRGFYPPDVEYMRSHYGLRYDEDKYVVRYDLFAVNLMPEITVLEAKP